MRYPAANDRLVSVKAPPAVLTGGGSGRTIAPWTR
jgi:hypothetical protein